ncbi:MAG TPA: shikimate dehydrogenase [Longimicrobiales bacterium]|nr:shikimate dehydrogenase [Longimicrobiales bacterium]
MPRESRRADADAAGGHAAALGAVAIRASTRVFALLGDPVAHSLSPLIQNAAFRAAELDAVYVALRCGTDDVRALMHALARAGGGGNVTVPHKQVAAAALESKSDAVRRTGACNTFWLENERLVGDNTDVEGFHRAIRAFLQDPRGARVLVLGAGGAAAAALVALLDAGIDSAVLVNRTMPRAEQLAARAGAPGDDRIRVAPTVATLRDQRFDLAVNATALGMRADDPQPVAIADASFAAAFDMVYAPGGTAWVRAARAAGLPAVDGHEMLLHQAAAAFQRWWQRPAPESAMRAALLPGAAEADPSTH